MHSGRIFNTTLRRQCELARPCDRLAREPRGLCRTAAVPFKKRYRRVIRISFRATPCPSRKRSTAPTRTVVCTVFVPFRCVLMCTDCTVKKMKTAKFRGKIYLFAERVFADVLLRDQEVAGSNPVAPILKMKTAICGWFLGDISVQIMSRRTASRPAAKRPTRRSPQGTRLLAPLARGAGGAGQVV